MRLYHINVKDYKNFDYSEFIVIGESINNMLENLYTELCPDKEVIPYYLRSSNFDITCLGEFTPNEKVTKKILCSRYENDYE